MVYCYCYTVWRSYVMYKIKVHTPRILFLLLQKFKFYFPPPIPVPSIVLSLLLFGKSCLSVPGSELFLVTPLKLNY